MAIELERTAQLWGITGNLGGGKTLTAVQFAVSAMDMGYYVCSNITLDMNMVCTHYGERCRNLYQHISLDDPGFDPFKLPCGSPRGSGGKKRVLIVLDECAEWVDQYSSAKDPRIARLWSWLRHSSKRSQDVFIIVQRPDYLNKVIRILISRWIWVNDLAVWRLPGLKMHLPFCGGLVMRNIFDSCKQRIGAVSFCVKSYWGRFYNTAECLNADGSTYNYEYELPQTRRMGKYWLLGLLVLSQFALMSSLARLRETPPDARYRDNRPYLPPCVTNAPGRIENASARVPAARRGWACPAASRAPARVLGLFNKAHCVQDGMTPSPLSALPSPSAPSFPHLSQTETKSFQKLPSCGETCRERASAWNAAFRAWNWLFKFVNVGLSQNVTREARVEQSFAVPERKEISWTFQTRGFSAYLHVASLCRAIIGMTVRRKKA